MADDTFLIAEKATGSDPDDWTEVEDLLSSVSSDVTLRALDWEFQPYATYQTLGDGLRKGRGSPVGRWKFGALRPEQRENVRDFCTGLSAEVYIRTPTNETASEVRVWRDYLATMHWTPNEEIVGVNAVEEIEIMFTNCLDVTPA